MELDLEARLIGEALILNRSEDPKFGDFIELNDLNEPLELRNHEIEDLGLIIKEGEVIDEPKAYLVDTRNDDIIVEGIDKYPSFCDYDRKIKINYAYNLQFSQRLKGNIPPPDMKPIQTIVADLSGTGAKYQVDQTQSTRSNVLIPVHKVKGVTTRSRKITSEATPSNEINETGINKNEPPKFKHDEQEKPHDVGVKNNSLSIPKRTTQPLLKSKFSDDEPWARILERSVGYNPKEWLEKLNDALWAFRTAYKTLTWCTPFRLVYGKSCHLPVEIEHKAHWALKQCNMVLTLGSKSRLMQINELAESRDGAYENTRIYKERTKKWHDSRLRGDKDFKVGGKVLL
nr:hypothetical protein [Tanacetum cinerariifolium]